MDDEISDILGQQTKPVLRTHNNRQHWLGASLTVKLAFGLAILLVLYVVAMRTWIRILVWKERSYKLAMRRRHGIPDNDHRPFNVAYAAVVRTRQEKDAAQRVKAKVTQPLPPHDRHNAQSEQNVRQRFGFQTTTELPRASSYSARVPGAYYGLEGTPARSSLQYTGLSVSPVSMAIPTRDHTHPQRVAPQQPGNDINSLQNTYRRPSRKELAIGDMASSHKRGFVEDPSDEQEVAKKSKWENGHIEDEADGVIVQPQRGAKRYLGHEDEIDDNLFERQPRDKRARKVSLEKAIQVQEDDSGMDVDEEEEDDDIDDLPSFRRGKKRDRAEAGSTFGGDDLDPDNPDPISKRRTRIRRTVSKRKSDVAILVRGQKRDRDSEEDESEVEGIDDIPYMSRKKRGKKVLLPDEASSEQTTSNSRASSASRGRKIGEEWSSNGIRWKVGPNGQRLRQALVKKSRQKFPMPEDSQHPDRDIDFEVFVETWLTEEEYRDAKAQHALAWQDSPQRFGEPEKLAVDVRSPAVGKNLLWSSTSTPVGSPATYSPASDYTLSSTHRARDPFRSSTTSAVGLRINPFDQPSIQSGRRISSITRSTSTGSTASPSLTDSTNSSPHARFKTYSKFEKQELEAQAILKLRELKSKKESEANRAREDQERAEKERAEKERVEKENLDKAKMAATPPPMVPTITVTAPPEAPKPQQASGPPKPAEAPQAPPLFASTTPAFTAPKPSEKPVNASGPTTSFFANPPTAASSARQGNSSTNHFLGISPQMAAPTTAGTKAESSTKSPALFSSPSLIGTSTNPPPTVAAQPNTAKPVFSFGATAPKPLTEQKALESSLPPASQSTNNPLLTRLGPPLNSTSAPATNPASNSAASQSVATFPTSKPATQSNPFSIPTNQNKTAQGPSSTAASTSTTTAAAPKFSFGFTNPTHTASTTTNTTPPQTQPTSKPAPQPLVNFVPLTAAGAKDSSESTANNAASTQPFFNFKIPTPSATTTNMTTGQSNVTASGTSSSAPQFSFAAPNGTSNITSFNPFGTPSTASAFGVGSFGKPAENKSAESSNTAPAKPLFSFGMNPGQSSNAAPSSGLFGTGNTGPKPPPSSSSLFGALDPQPSTIFGASTSTNNSGSLVASNGTGGSTGGFGTTTATPSSQPTSSTTGPPGSASMGGSTNPFGAPTNQPTEASKTPFSFASPSAPNGNVTAKPADAPKPLFNFSGPTATNEAVATSSSGPNTGSSFSFNFGAPTKDTTASTTPQTSPFAVRPGTFTFGAPATASTAIGGQVFGGFGAASNATQQK